MINDIDEINVVIQDTDSVEVTEGTPTDIAEIMHNEEIRIANENERIANETQRINNEEDREEYITELKQRVLNGEFDGEDGFSPIANVSKSGDTATISITDKNGTTTATISDGTDGRDGVDGQDGTDGEDGFSPVVTMEKQGKVTTLTITDATGTHTTEIKDGNDGSGTGDMLKATYDTNDNGVVDNAEKVNNHTVLTDVPANAVFTDTTYTAGTGIDITNNVISSTQSSAEWGNITGTLSNQTDLQNSLNNKQNIIQYYSMPTAGATYEDKIVQFVGTTDNTYTNGYFYICVNNSGTYSWENLNVQDLAADSFVYYINLTSATSVDKDKLDEICGLSSSDLKKVLIINSGNSTDNSLYLKKLFVIGSYENNDLSMFSISFNMDTVANSGTNSLRILSYDVHYNSTTRVVSSIYSSTSQITDGNFLSTSVNYPTPYTPVYDGSPATKKYVDDNKFSGNYNDLSNKPTIPSKTSDLNNDSNFISTSSTSGLIKNDGTIDTTSYSTFSGSYNDLSNKPTIPDELADLSDDSTHRVVTDTEKTTWSGKQDALVSGTNIKTINNTSLLGSGNISLNVATTQVYSADTRLYTSVADTNNIITVNAVQGTVLMYFITYSQPLENWDGGALVEIGSMFHDTNKLWLKTDKEQNYRIRISALYIPN